MRRSCLISLLILCLPVILPAQVSRVETDRAVLRAQDQRDASSLQTFLQNEDAWLRARSAYAAGSVQDTTLIGSLISLLSDKSPLVRKAAAFALGQLNYVVTPLQRSAVSLKVVQVLKTEKDSRVASALVEALGKVGDEGSLRSLVAFGGVTKNNEIRAEISLSIGRFAYRNIKNEEGTRFAAEMLGALKEGDRWKAGYALMRIGDMTFLEPYGDTVIKAVRDGDADTRMYGVTILGKIKTNKSGLAAVTESSVSDPDWRVRVNAIKALGQFEATPSSINLLVQLIDDPNEHLSLTALASLKGMQIPDADASGRIVIVLHRTINDTTGHFTGRQKGEAAATLAKLQPRDSYPFLQSAYSGELLSAEAFVAALGLTEDDRAFQQLLEFSKKGSPRVQRIALEAIENICNRQSATPERIRAARNVFIGALQEGDMAVTATAASALGDSSLIDSSSVKPLSDALSRLRSPNDVEPMVSIIQSLGSLKRMEAVPVLETLLSDSDRTVSLEVAAALQKITSRSYAESVTPHTRLGHSDYDWETIEWIAKHAVVEVVTERGKFSFKMLPRVAPFTCLNFARLIRNGFYSGLTFHRVVPNFVVQGGDPRGDGWGGPGYAIRSEFGYERYDRGSVGVASSGKDTEGCQFFVTHSRQPHLDGRYTIFGKVISGMDIVDALQVGEKILEMKFVEGK